jgi:sugar phosphate permease
VVEGVAASIVGVWAFWYLEDRPQTSRRLAAADRDVLVAAVEAEEAAKGAHSPASVARSLADRKVLYLALIYFTIQMSVYGVTFYLPSQVAELAGAEVGFEVGLLTAIPWTCALVASFLVGRYSDSSGNRRLVAAVTLAVGGVGIAASAAFSAPTLAMVALCFGAAGFIAVQPVFWTIPTGYLSGAAAASGIALINSLGSLGGFVAPNVKNWADQSFGSGQAGLYVLAGTTLLGALLILGVTVVGLRGREGADPAAMPQQAEVR